MCVLKEQIPMKKFIPLIIIIFALSIFAYITPMYGFSVENYTTIYIGENEKKNTGPIFNNSQIWYPGHSVANILRIKNNLGNTAQINKIGMNINLEKSKENCQEKDKKDFMNNFKIKIEYKNPIRNIIKGVIYNGTFEDFKNGAQTFIQVGSKDYIDLIYTIKMDENAQSNIAGIKATADFFVDVTDYSENNNYNNGYIISQLPYQSVKDIPQPAAQEDDIEQHWSHNCINTLLKNKIIQGYDNGAIRPDKRITRAEAAVLTAKAIGIKEDNDENYIYYTDTLPKWAKGYTIALTKQGILDGYNDKTFKPNKYISREEMTKVLVKAFNKPLNTKIKLKFKDKNEISLWALKYIKSGVDSGAIEGYPDNTFRPKDKMSRAESFTLICKLTKLHNEHKEN